MRMNDLKPLDLQDPRIKSGHAKGRAGKKAAIYFLVVLIVAVMVAWLGFLGWGVVELVRSIAAYL
jgi:hypothetical protein